MTFIYLFFYQTPLSCFLSKGIESTCRHCSTLSDCRGIVLVCSSFFFHCWFLSLLSLSLRNTSAFIVVVALTTGIVMVTPMTITWGWWENSQKRVFWAAVQNFAHGLTKVLEPRTQRCCCFSFFLDFRTPVVYFWVIQNIQQSRINGEARSKPFPSDAACRWEKGGKKQRQVVRSKAN